MTISSFWYLLSAVCLLLFLYPYVFYPLILRLLPKQPYHTEQNADISNLSVALAFCAFNEEQVLPEKLRNVRTLKQYYPELQVLAYSDCSDDSTNQLLKEADDVLMPVVGTARVGKVMGMQKLVSMTNKDVIIFTDANVILEPESVPRILRYFSNSNIGAVAGTLSYVINNDASATPTAKVGGLYWRLEESIKRLESDTGSTMGADGSIFARRREGYPVLPGDLVDDLAASISVLFDGLRCISAPDVRAYERSVGISSEEFRRKRRIACGAMSTYRYLLPQLRKLNWIDRFKFLSHKTIRWWGAFYLLFALGFAMLGGWSSGFVPVLIMLISGAGVIVWLLGVKSVPLISPIYEISLALIATGVGVIESLVGRKYQTWAPAKSR